MSIYTNLEDIKLPSLQIKTKLKNILVTMQDKGIVKSVSFTNNVINVLNKDTPTPSIFIGAAKVENDFEFIRENKRIYKFPVFIIFNAKEESIDFDQIKDIALGLLDKNIDFTDVVLGGYLLPTDVTTAFSDDNSLQIVMIDLSVVCLFDSRVSNNI